MRIDAGDLSVNYELDGPPEAPVVAFSHCLAGNLDIWRGQAKALADEFRVLRYDSRGHGGTSATDPPYSMDVLAEDLVHLLDGLGIRKAHFVGISMGGMIGQTLALRHPERIEGLILCDTTCRIPPEAGPMWQERIEIAREQGMSALSEETLQRWLSPGFRQERPEVEAVIRRMIESTPVRGFEGCCQAIREFDLAEAVPEIASPTLVMVGENDPGTTVDMARDLQNRISGAELQILPQAFHLANIEAEGEFNDVVLRFLGGL
jgi:3-oxoadipate enol-lactonase